MKVMEEKYYAKDDLTVVWKSDLCIHSGNCVRGLKEVFDPKRRPWIDLAAADKRRIIEQVEKCPSGALSYILEDKPSLQDQTTSEIVVTTLPNGPLQLSGTCRVTLANGETVFKEDKSFFCRCGASSNKPFCDGSHKKVEFRD